MKKLNKFFAILVAMAMVLSLTVISAFAANPATSTTPGEGVNTKITKAFDEPAGLTNRPTVKTYKFTVLDKNTDASKNLGSKTVTLTDPNELTSNDILKAFLEDESLKEKLAAGKYTFKVTENRPTTQDGYDRIVDDEYDNIAIKETTVGNFKTTETTTYSLAEYEVQALVATDTAADGTVKYYIQSSAVTIKTDDNGNEVTQNNKPQTGGDENTVAFTFKNKYNKKVENLNQPGTSESQDPTTLKINKKVTDLNKEDDKAPTDQAFKFKATIKFPANSTEPSYTAKVKEMNGENIVVTNQEVTFTKVTEGADKDTATATFTLKDGQWLSFDNIEVGAVVTSLVEDSYPGFTAKNEIEDADHQKTITDAAAGNAVEIENEWDASSGSLTGILMSNIPYIVLALVAIGGLCAYVVVRRKNADEA